MFNHGRKYMKKIDINTVSPKALNEQLPMGAYKVIEQRLIQAGNPISYPTIRRAFDPDYSATEKTREVLKEAIAYLQELRQKHTIKVMPEIAETLTPTGS